MSTKCTIVHGPGFHFYHEILDDDHVYLELETTHFEVGYGRVMLPIPIHIWETIRHLGAARMDLADKEDGALVAMIERNVDKRIAEYQQAVNESPDRAGLVGNQAAIEREFPIIQPLWTFEASYNVAPTQLVPVIRIQDGRRSALRGASGDCPLLA
jgi:hypothetical protein